MWAHSRFHSISGHAGSLSAIGAASLCLIPLASTPAPRWSSSCLSVKSSQPVAFLLCFGRGQNYSPLHRLLQIIRI
ncbi:MULTISPECIES: hypothetical protein [Aminobacterium]|uniref:hypothetical protein n=1 Tax=Aminobacterium TaxID=81466 RepID=UPI0003187CF0|nr:MULTISPECIES: hypothetical protein [unclassified Aminobacterium]